MSLAKQAIHQLSSLLENREISSEELTRYFLGRIEQLDGSLKAYITVTRELALEQAREVDSKRAQGEKLSPLAGIPMAVKDNISTKGVRTTCASKMLHNYIPPYNATVMDKLQEAGYVLLGKSNMDEFALGSSTEKSYYYPTRNPYRDDVVPGGSSGGSAAAVAAGEAVYALGSDTGGSVRQPAAFCGLVGLKPTFGMVSRYGVIGAASSLDQVGTLTKDVTDTALVLNAICGYDSRDSVSMPVEKPDYTRFLTDNVKGLKIGIPREYLAAGSDPRIIDYLKMAAAKLEELGAVCEEVSLPHTEYAVPAYYIILSAEASSNFGRFDGVRYGLRVEAEDTLSMYCKTRSEGFGEEIKRRIMLGTYFLSAGNFDAYYRKALKVRTLVKNDFAKVFEKVDCLLAPTTPGVAFGFGEKDQDPLAMSLSDRWTVPVNLAGLPALSLPFGMIEGLPVGIQFIGKAFAEGTILQAAYTLEQHTDLTRPHPQLEGVN